MKKVYSFVAMLFATFAISSGASATTLNLGNVTAGMSGTLVDYSWGGILAKEYDVVGKLAANTVLDITLTATNVKRVAMLSGYLTFDEGKIKLPKMALPTLSMGVKWDVDTPYTKTISIVNNGDALEKFAAYFLFAMRGGCGCGDFSITYNASEVPLPGAALLFGSGLLGLGGLRLRKKA